MYLFIYLLLYEFGPTHKDLIHMFSYVNAVKLKLPLWVLHDFQLLWIVVQQIHNNPQQIETSGISALVSRPELQN